MHSTRIQHPTGVLVDTPLSIPLMALLTLFMLFARAERSTEKIMLEVLALISLALILAHYTVSRYWRRLLREAQELLDGFSDDSLKLEALDGSGNIVWFNALGQLPSILWIAPSVWDGELCVAVYHVVLTDDLFSVEESVTVAGDSEPVSSGLLKDWAALLLLRELLRCLRTHKFSEPEVAQICEIVIEL